MQIYCPKCKTGYEIEADVVPEKGRRLRCAVCGKIFKCMPEDLIDGSKLRTAEFTEEEKLRLDEDGHLQDEDVEETAVEAENKAVDEPETDEEEAAEEGLPGKSLEELEEEARAADSENVKDIFKRLSEETEALFKAESEEKPAQKAWKGVIKNLGLKNPRNYKYYYFALLVFVLLGAYYARYEIVRAFPSMEPIYTVLGIKSRVTGEGLEFQNVTRREYEEDAVRYLEIKGFIVNKTKRTLDIPTIYAELLDKDAKLIQTQKAASVIPIITADGRVAFSFVVDRPSKLTKYIYLTFSDEK